MLHSCDGQAPAARRPYAERRALRPRRGCAATPGADCELEHARSWTALQYQRLSVVLHIAAATEIINELGYGDGEAAAGRRAYIRQLGRRR